MSDGLPRYTTVIGKCNALAGWREHRNGGGMLLSVPQGDMIADALSMPHSPRIIGDYVMLIESARGMLVRIDPATGEKADIAFCPGFARGLSVIGDLAVVRLSLPREISIRELPNSLPVAKSRGAGYCSST